MKKGFELYVANMVPYATAQWNNCNYTQIMQFYRIRKNTTKLFCMCVGQIFKVSQKYDYLQKYHKKFDSLLVL